MQGQEEEEEQTLDQPIYQQFMIFPPPERFARTVVGYFNFINGLSGGKYTQRRMSEEVGKQLYDGPQSNAHNLLHSIITPRKDGKYTTPRTNTINAIVAVINSKVPEFHWWPPTAAWEAAGRVPESNSEKAIEKAGEIRRTQMRALQERDQFELGQSQVGAKIYDINHVASQGLSRAAYRERFWFSNDMAIMIGIIPGYPQQQSEDDWVICQSPENVLDEDNVYALVREGPLEVRAIPKAEALDRQQDVIVWLMAVLRFVSPPPLIRMIVSQF